MDMKLLLVILIVCAESLYESVQYNNNTPQNRAAVRPRIRIRRSQYALFLRLMRRSDAIFRVLNKHMDRQDAENEELQDGFDECLKRIRCNYKPCKRCTYIHISYVQTV